MKLVFATNNKNKLQEVRNILEDGYSVLGLKEIGCLEELPETNPTIEQNATQKAQYVHEKYSVDCFADDTGLEIEALNGRPGVYSARYAGEHCSFEDNMNKVLEEMEDKENRNACFRTVISLFIDSEENQFEGRINGTILREKRGEEGFGYDPIFKPKGYTQSFAEMDLNEKNRISHRALATLQLIEFLKGT